jgi:hypothetical protein
MERTRGSDNRRGRVTWRYGKEQRAEVTVRYDVKRLSEIVGELRRMGAIDGEATECD